MTVRGFVDAVVLASTAAALGFAPRVPARRPRALAPERRRSLAPFGALAVVTGVIYVNQVLFTVYVLRVHGGDPAFVARYLPAGWFDTATGEPVLRWLAEVWPAPALLAPSVLRVQAFLELPFVLLAFMTVVRWLDAGLYRRLARSVLLPLASVSYTAVFCLVEWDLYNPYTVDDLVVRAVSAVVTPWCIARMAARDAGEGRTPATVSGLLVLVGSLGALGVLVLVVYDTALLYNLGRLGERLPVLLGAAGALAGLRRGASRLGGGPAFGGLALSFLRHGLGAWLALFLVPALAVRYGVMFGTPALSAGAAAVLAAAACVTAGREALAEGPGARRSGDTRRRPPAVVLVGRLACAALVGTGAAYAVTRFGAGPYYEVTLLAAAAAFLVTVVLVCRIADTGRVLDRGTD
ncbi:hypothetical protein ACL02U_24820 [Streptomyces sp. MS06]|uniref:hypothetical protein n=1 Tax=Streptomyces sp. MS06 TaxID=3385974 RepID=UPI0039A226D7